MSILNTKIANGDTSEIGALAPSITLSRLAALLESLASAPALLGELEDDITASDGARTFGEQIGAVKRCRLALDAIEMTARRVACEDARWHAAKVTDWARVGVTPERE